MLTSGSRRWERGSLRGIGQHEDSQRGSILNGLDRRRPGRRELIANRHDEAVCARRGNEHANALRVVRHEKRKLPFRWLLHRKHGRFAEWMLQPRGVAFGMGDAAAFVLGEHEPLNFQEKIVAARTAYALQTDDVVAQPRRRWRAGWGKARFGHPKLHVLVGSRRTTKRTKFVRGS